MDEFLEEVRRRAEEECALDADDEAAENGTEWPGRAFDPRCKRWADEIPEVRAFAAENNMTPDGYVKLEEGTYNRSNGHFLCDECYIAAGMPVAIPRWVCP